MVRVVAVSCLVLLFAACAQAGILAPGPYVSCVTDNSVVVSWITTTSTSTNRVDYGLTSSYGSSANSYQDVTATEDAGTYYVHSAKLTGLSVNTTYRYRAVSDSDSDDNGGAGWPVKTFPAVGTTDFSFIVYGDCQYAGESGSVVLPHERVMRGIMGENPCLVLNEGDIVASSNNFIEWSGHSGSGNPQGEFFRIVGGKFKLMQGTWIAPAKGNHVLMGSYPTLYATVFENPYSGNGMGSNTTEDYFAFDYAKARVIFLNHNGSQGMTQGDAQYNWLVSELSAAQAAGKWIIVLVHQPPFVPDTDDRGKYNDGYMFRLQEYIVPLFQQYGVDLVVAGHNHVTVVWKKALNYKGRSAPQPVIEEVTSGVHYTVQATATGELDDVDSDSNGISETWVFDNAGSHRKVYNGYNAEQYDLEVYAAGKDRNTTVFPTYAVVTISGDNCTVTTKGMYNAGSSDNGNWTPTVIDTLTFSRGSLAPVADFSGNPTSGAAPLTVAFTDLSSGSPTSWSWTFGDSGTSTAQSPSHVYNSANSYTVSLTATNASGSDTETKTSYITVVQAQDYTCASLTVNTGSLVSGDHTSVHASDSVYLVVHSAKVGNKQTAQVSYTFNSGLGSLSYLTATLEGKVSAGTQPLTVYAYNYSTSSWTSIATGTLTTTDSTVNPTVSNPSQYVSGGTVQIRVKAGGSGSTTFDHATDLVKITAAP